MRDIQDRVDIASGRDTLTGRMVWAPAKSLWYLFHASVWLTVGILQFSWGAVAAFLILSIIILCGGHSIGMHRKLIHDSFDCPLWLARFGAYLGTLVGLGGPFTLMRAHDMRDWAQRQTDCHPFFSQHSSIARDWLWQIHMMLKLDDGPEMIFPDKLTKDLVMIWLQRTVLLQQIPIALALYSLGDWGWVAWGISGRIVISVTGHWLIGWFAHNHGPRDWEQRGHGVQGHNVPGPMKLFGFITFGECWHNNHHAFPESAKLGLMHGQVDPGWWVLCALEKFGLVKNIVQARDLPHNSDLHPLFPKPPEYEKAVI